MGMRISVLLVLAFLPMPQAVAAEKSAASAQVICADLVAGCSSADGVFMRFSQIPKPMQAFRLEVAAKGSRQLRASFEMRDMDMGSNRYRLLPKGGKWHAQVMLPACMHGSSDWVMRLEVDGRVYEIPFRTR
jgi:hypothetical protein